MLVNDRAVIFWEVRCWLSRYIRFRFLWRLRGMRNAMSMWIPFVRNAERQVAVSFWPRWGFYLVRSLLLVSLTFRVEGATVCLEGKKTVVLSTAWRFVQPAVRVGNKIPIGTVIASALIPEGQKEGWCRGDIRAGLWDGSQLQSRYLMLDTNLSGVRVRMSLEPTLVPQALPDWMSGPIAQVRQRTRGRLRVELVKTGNVRAGILTSVRGRAQYRTYSGALSHERLAMMESLHYVGQLVIEVSGPVSVQGHQRLS